MEFVAVTTAAGAAASADRPYSLQPHLPPTAAAAVAAAHTAVSPTSPRQSLHLASQHQAPVVPDAYVGMRLAANSSSSESIDLASRDPTPPPPPLQQQFAASTFRCAPLEFRHPADELPLTDIALDGGGLGVAAAGFGEDQFAFSQLPQQSPGASANSAPDDLDDADFSLGVGAGGGVGGLLNPSVVADIANDIRDIKRAIAMQRRPLPPVIPTASVSAAAAAAAAAAIDDSEETGDGGSGVWIRRPGSQAGTSHSGSQHLHLQQQQQQHQHQQPNHQSQLQPQLQQQFHRPDLYEHRHPFYDNDADRHPSHHSDSMHQPPFVEAAPVVRNNGNHHYQHHLPAAGAAFAAPSSAQIVRDHSSLLQQQQQQQRQDVFQQNMQQQQIHSAAATAFARDDRDYDSDVDTDGLMTKQYTSTERRVEIPELSAADKRCLDESRKDKGREVAVRHPDQPTVLIEGLLFRALYLGSTQLVTEGQPSKSTRMAQAQEAVGRIKAPDGENQPCVPVDLFISTEKIMVLNTNLQEIMMDHALKTISYIADIGNILVLMARRRFLQQTERRQTRIVCHVFETDEAQLVAQSIGHAFQVAYMDFLRANGIDDPGYQLRDMDYQDVLNQQDIISEELALFSRRDMQKEVLVPKAKGEPLGVVIVESGWGSMLPTVVLANMQPSGPAARCGQLNIGDQLLSINGVSLVGLPLANCQQQVKSCRGRTAVKVTLVSCPPVVEVLIRRPDVKFQLGFSVQNGVICSLLRGGIAERGGVRVGHRIIEINGQSVVATPHDRIVAMLASGVGEIHMKTMPTSIFRLLTGQEAPHYI